VSGSGDGRLIGFHLGDAGAALPLGIVRQVTERPRVVRVPGTHAFVSGVALHDGVALPVYHLGRLAALWSDPDRAGAVRMDADRLIVCDWGETGIGLLGGRVDLVEGEDGTPDAGEEDERSGLSGAFVKRFLRVRGETIALLDTERLFASLGLPAAGPGGRRETGEDDPAGG